MEPLTLYIRITDETGHVSGGPWQIGPGTEWMHVNRIELAHAVREAARKLDLVIEHLEREARPRNAPSPTSPPGGTIERNRSGEKR